MWTISKTNYEQTPAQNKIICMYTRLFSFSFSSSFFFRSTPVAYESFQARGQIGDAAAGLCHSHSNAISKLHLQPTPQLMAMPDP